MNLILLTQNQTFIIGWVARLLGLIMDGIFYVIDLIGIPNVGLAIILFTIVVNLLMLPLTIKQQKFSKLSAKMNPEIQAIQQKYKNKRDNDSMMAQNQEIQAVYAKYGVNPSGSCVQLLIQFPILLALYRVIYSMPAYVGKIKEAFFPLVDNLIAQEGSAEFIQEFKNAGMYLKQFSNELFVNGDITYVRNTFVDVLNKASTAEFSSIAEKFPSVANDVNNTLELLNKYNNFLGINIGNSPSFTVSQGWNAEGGVQWLVIIGALAIPLLSALTQWINVKLMPQAASNSSDSNDQQNSMVQSMKMMNTMMPIMSAIFCYTLPAGMGLYWIAGSVVRSIQQVVINKHFDKMDFEEIIKQNAAKSAKKMEKLKKNQERINAYANMNTKGIQGKANVSSDKTAQSASVQSKSVQSKTNSSEKTSGNSGSIASKANLVRQYNEKNNHK